jgi:hypothetical protein
MHRDLTFLLADDQHRRSYRCGTVPEHPYRLCHKSHSRLTWRCCTAETAHHAARRRRKGRQGRKCVRRVALAACSVRTDRAES